MQCVTKDTGQAFAGLGKASRETFLTCILFEKPTTLPSIVRDLSMFPVKKSGLDPQITLKSAKDKYNSLLREICELVGAVKVKRVFPTADHISVI